MLKSILYTFQKQTKELENLKNESRKRKEILNNIILKLNFISNNWNKNIRIKNKGTGAGGCNTNKNGLNYEYLTYLPRLLNIEKTKVNFGKGLNDYYYVYKNFIILKHGSLYKYLCKVYNMKCEKKLNPDECIIDNKLNKLYIIEKKFQQCAGSVDEKIQTALFKKWYYEEQYPTYKIIYIYVLSDWFKQDKYKPEMRYFKKNNIQVLFSSDSNYITKLLNLL